MAENIQCNYCENLATVHLTQIVNNQVKKIDLCEDCAKNKGLSSPQGISLSDMFSGALEAQESGQQGLACPICGFTHSDFRSQGRLGCPACYESFRPILMETLDAMHPGTHHVGKRPNHLMERTDSRQKETHIEECLQQAIAEENYEEAAKLRDELAELRAKYELASATEPQQ